LVAQELYLLDTSTPAPRWISLSGGAPDWLDCDLERVFFYTQTPPVWSNGELTVARPCGRVDVLGVSP
jgi:hypothetical protein